jgi:hypothetical protein
MLLSCCFNTTTTTTTTTTTSDHVITTKPRTRATEVVSKIYARAVQPWYQMAEWWRVTKTLLYVPPPLKCLPAYQTVLYVIAANTLKSHARDLCYVTRGLSQNLHLNAVLLSATA